MATNATPISDVLHPEKHSKLSDEEIAKAVARHNKHHPEGKAGDTAPKSNKAPKK